MSRSTLVAFMDADCVPDRAWLVHLVDAIQDPEVAGCTGRTVDFESGRAYENRLDAHDFILPCAGFGNVVYRRAVIDELGFLDENLCLYAEEPDFCWRLYLKSYRIEYAPAALVAHKTHRSARKFFLYGTATRYLVRKFGKLFPISPMAELHQVLEFERTARAGRGSPSIPVRLKPAAALAGYVHALAREKLGLPPRIQALHLDDTTLRPQREIPPLEVSVGGQRLVRPNHVLWWRTQEGCSIQNLRPIRRYDLSGPSGEIWMGLMRGGRMDEIVAALRRDYDAAEETVRCDVEDFLTTLLAEGLVVVAQ